MKRIEIIVLFMALLSPLTGRVQASPEARINRIKADTGYLFGEGTMATQEEAVILAKNILRNHIEAWKKGETGPVPDTEELLAGCEQVLAMRGPKHRAFVYIPKPGGAPITTGPETENGTEPPGQSENQPTAPEPEPKPVQKPEPWNFPTEALCACRNLSEVIDLCTSEKVAPHIECGNVSRASDLNEVGKSLLVIYATTDNSVRAVFDKKNEAGNRINLFTRKPDSTRNYPGCQAMWIKIKE